MVGWHHQLNGHEFEQTQTQGDGEGQGSLACYSPWGRQIRHDLATEQHQHIVRRTKAMSKISKSALTRLC